jgi:hypothetical protein
MMCNRTAGKRLAEALSDVWDFDCARRTTGDMCIPVTITDGEEPYGDLAQAHHGTTLSWN